MYSPSCRVKSSEAALIVERNAGTWGQTGGGSKTSAALRCRTLSALAEHRASEHVLPLDNQRALLACRPYVRGVSEPMVKMEEGISE